MRSKSNSPTPCSFSISAPRLAIPAAYRKAHAAYLDRMRNDPEVKRRHSLQAQLLPSKRRPAPITLPKFSWDEK